MINVSQQYGRSQGVEVRRFAIAHENGRGCINLLVDVVGAGCLRQLHFSDKVHVY